MLIRDENNLDPGSGMEKIRIRDPGGGGTNITDPQHWLGDERVSKGLKQEQGRS